METDGLRHGRYLSGYQKKIKNVNTVTEAEYQSRLDTCLECENLLYGTTCRFCGCIVQIKNKLTAANCPFPYAPKWKGP
ncbi:MAG: DUF6171 family protein [Treponema sp.]|jgi:hypothetical protein|nr:DUF6171 family protein [Treponema sp.]